MESFSDITEPTVMMLPISLLGGRSSATWPLPRKPSVAGLLSFFQGATQGDPRADASHLHWPCSVRSVVRHFCTSTAAAGPTQPLTATTQRQPSSAGTGAVLGRGKPGRRGDLDRERTVQEVGWPREEVEFGCSCYEPLSLSCAAPIQAMLGARICASYIVGVAYLSSP